MRELDLRSIRILIDMQACQSAGSAQRGVGRFSFELFSALASQASPRELHSLTGSDHAVQLPLNSIMKQRQHQLEAMPDWKTSRDFDGGEQDTIDAELAASIAGRVSPDIIHISHIFEGHNERIAIPISARRPAGQVLSATLYDLIPLRFSEHYFQDEHFKRWYFHRLKWLRQADLLLSISESSRQDAIELLGIEPERIVTIYGGISEHFKPTPNTVEARRRICARYGLDRSKIILYTGGDDHRKNLNGVLAAYAALPVEVRRSSHLVLVCSIEEHRKAAYLKFASTLGAIEHDVVFVGYVPEDDLVAFYSTCDVFVFPSLYEGLGLPVLEAMACGAPVITGNNSSLLELAPDSAALFDSSNPSSVSERILRVLSDQDLSQMLRRSGLSRAADFSWEQTGRTALDAFDAALERKREAGVCAALTKWIKPRRLAMFTPLPPCRSGIADYNAKFLPYLAEHFEIDIYVDGYAVTDSTLNATFRVFEAKSFSVNANSYDAILYELGNSEFHAYMLPLLKLYPGVVGLHDAFLSGLIGYLEFNLGQKDSYTKEMLAAHGAKARRLFKHAAKREDGVAASMVELPCIKSVLDGSIGVISHSPFNLKVAREFHPEGWSAPFRIIPQMVASAALWSDDRMLAARQELGFGAEDFIISTFGQVVWTKCGDRLIEAFLNSEAANDRCCHLLFVGELAKDNFGSALESRIRKSGMADRIKVTGFLDESVFEKYLRITDLAIQLRSKSRGGTPKGVLDCMSQGIAVMINDDASYKDYPDDVTIKLSADPQFLEIAREIEHYRRHPDERKGFGLRGRAYVLEEHNAKKCAAKYASAIHEFCERRLAARPEAVAELSAPHLAGTFNPIGAARDAAAFHDAAMVPSFARPRVIIDVSHIAEKDHGTGIQRVVRESVKAAYLSDRSGIDAVAVELQGGQLGQATEWLTRQELLLPFEVENVGDAAFSLTRGDHLLMLDSSWARFDEFAPIFDRARAQCVPITTAVYDLLPITLPPGHFVPGGKEWFEGWLRKAIEASDNLIGISKAVADDLIEYVRALRIGRQGLKIGYWRLGSELAMANSYSHESPIAGIARPYFLMVGTVEPRKNHGLALDTFEELWKRGVDLSLVIVGKAGWMVDELMERLSRHEQLGKRLYFLPQISDSGLSYLYKHAEALFFPSKGEGYGLPLVEAANHGTPILCSDIPVFREIAGPHASYLALGTFDIIAESILKWRENPTGRDSSGMPRFTWKQSTEELLSVVTGDKWYYVHAT